MKSNELDGRFSWSKVKSAFNALRQDVLQRTPSAGNDISVSQPSDNGTLINSEVGQVGSPNVTGDRTLDLQVCIGGVTQTVTFVVKGPAH